jgi:hypothetical protein
MNMVVHKHVRVKTKRERLLQRQKKVQIVPSIAVIDKNSLPLVSAGEGQNQPEIELYEQQSRLVGLSRGRIQFNPTLLDEQKNGDLMWTARHVVR